MADSSIGLSPAVAGGDVLDAELLDGKKREVIVIGGDDASAEQADVRNAAPGAADYGLVTRNIPSGTQAVSGTVGVNNFPAGGATEATLALLKTRADLLATEAKLEAVRAQLAATLTVAGTVALDAPTLVALETISVANFPAWICARRWPDSTSSSRAPEQACLRSARIWSSQGSRPTSHPASWASASISPRAPPAWTSGASPPAWPPARAAASWTSQPQAPASTCGVKSPRS